MKPYYTLFFVALAFVFITACEVTVPKIETIGEKPNESAKFDSTLAAELQADAYGMSRYIMAFLKSGPNRSQDSAEAARLQRAHLDNIDRLVKEGKMVMAGPFLDEGEMRGIYIFNVETVEEALELTATDPSIKAGRLEMELHPWYGSATLKMNVKWHEKVVKKKI